MAAENLLLTCAAMETDDQAAMKIYVPQDFPILVIEKVCELFAPSEYEQVYELLRKRPAKEREQGNERVLVDLLQVSAGSVDKVAKMVRSDYRDIIVAAEYELKNGKLAKKPDPA